MQLPEIKVEGEEANELVNRWLVYIGDAMKTAGYRSVSVDGLRHFVQYVQAEVLTMQDRLAGMEDGRPAPGLRDRTLEMLRREFPDPLPPRP